MFKPANQATSQLTIRLCHASGGAVIRPEDLSDKHTAGFLRDHSDVCAAHCLKLGPLFLPVTYRQLTFYLLHIAMLFLFFLWDWKIFWTVLTFILCGFYGAVIVSRLVSVKWALFRSLMGRPSEHRIAEEELAALKDAELPVYTILVPMYKEPEVAQKVARYVTELDYPQEKLDVKILLEEDDPETRAKIDEVFAQLPPCVEVIVCPRVPKGQPKTKPRACNWGLERARGEYLVIYDAEDRPEGDQLKKAVAAFRKLKQRGRDRVVCLQAKLNYFNARQNFLTRFFTLEYTAWFDLFLPGLHAFRIPIPLGGTSNHFNTQVLKDLGGWDPFNVTEDCDLGIRMARKGYLTEVLDSTTWEEANSRVGNWIRQRSRWMKGYFQTHLVHARRSWMPALLLGIFFAMLAHYIAVDLEAGSYQTEFQLQMAGISIPCAIGGAILCALLGGWTLAENVRDRFRAGAGQAMRPLGVYDAVTFRLTVGGMASMLVLNIAFWLLSAAYLFREPLYELTGIEALREWKLYYANVSDEMYQGYTIWKAAWHWLTGQIDGGEARLIFQAVDKWSFWSQILYPVVIGLFLANFVFIALGLVSCGLRGLWDLAPFAVLMPFYWVLISVGAIKGICQLFTNPFYWEKTLHGLAAPPANASGPPSNPPPADGGAFYTAAR